MLARYGDTRGMEHMPLHPMRTKPARQPEAVSTGFEGQCNPRDLAAGLDRLVAPAMQQAKQPFCTRLQLLARLALNAGKHTGNQPARLAHLDDGNDCAILVQGDEGPAQVVRLGHQGTPSLGCSDDGAISSPPAPYHLSPGGRWIRTSGTADDARLLADLYAHNASRQMPQKGSSDQAVACLRRLGAGVVGSAAVCAFRFRPPGTGSKRAGWRRSGAIFAFFAAVCFEPDAFPRQAAFQGGHEIDDGWRGRDLPGFNGEPLHLGFD